MADRSKTIIVKKIKKGHGGGHHGGSWKVAYADFVTAMMAFFLLLWLLTMTSSEKRAVLAQYFKNFSLFSESGTSFMKESSEIFQQAGGEVKSSGSPVEQAAGETSSQIALATEALKEQLKKAVQKKLKAAKDQVMVDLFEGGVRIQIVDNEGSSMFPSGSTQPTEKAKAILGLVSENIKDTIFRIAVEGHTDSVGSRKVNWDLSTGRASAARHELEKNGVDSSKISRVVGYADTELLFKDKPTDARNRRISLILLQPKPQELPPAPKDLKLEPQLKAIQPLNPTVPEFKIQKAFEEKPVIQKQSTDQGQSKNLIGPDLGIKPQRPIEILRPIDIPSIKPLYPMQPLVEKPSVEKPVPQKQEKYIWKQYRPVPKQKEKPVTEKKNKTDQTQKKGKIDIAPRKPIDNINAIPELNR